MEKFCNALIIRHLAGFAESFGKVWKTQIN